MKNSPTSYAHTEWAITAGSSRLENEGVQSRTQTAQKALPCVVAWSVLLLLIMAARGAAGTLDVSGTWRGPDSIVYTDGGTETGDAVFVVTQQGSTLNFSETLTIRTVAPGKYYDSDDYPGEIFTYNYTGAISGNKVTVDGVTGSGVLDASGTTITASFDLPVILSLSEKNTYVLTKDTTPSGPPPISSSPPIIVTEPVSQSVPSGATVIFSVQASGTAPLLYQWSFRGTQIRGATSSHLTLTNVTSGDVGSYTVQVSNVGGTAQSTPASLSLSSTGVPGRLVNLSARAIAGNGSEMLITGFVVRGDGPLPLLLSGAGPALGNYGVVGFVTDPVLTLFSGETVIASNDNWWTDGAVAGTAARAGAMAFSSGSLDAAMVQNIAAGAYTAQITSKDGKPGVALAALYDASGLVGDVAPELINISARAQVGTGENVLIAGFVVVGDRPRTLLIRAIGPSLASYGVTGVLLDPQITLFRGSTQIDHNDNWGDTDGVPKIALVSSQVGAFPLPASSKDAALLATLPPGAYTAQVSGVADTSGVALVEVYLVPEP